MVFDSLEKLIIFFASLLKIYIFLFQYTISSFEKESLNERLLADITPWINLQLEMNEEIIAFNDGVLIRVCVDDICIDILMPTTTPIPTVAPSITGK